MQLPAPPAFPPAELTLTVAAEVAAPREGVSTVEGFDLPVTAPGVVEALRIFLAERLAAFGSYEDAMTEHSALLYHSGLSPLLKLGLLIPLQLVRAAEAAYVTEEAPLKSTEGFISDACRRYKGSGGKPIPRRS